MSSSSIILTHTSINGGVPVAVKAEKVSASGNINLQMNPNSNAVDMVEVQTQSYENYKYTITGIHFTNEANVLSWSDITTLYKERYSGSNPIVLNITYGDGTVLSGLSGSTDINCVIKTPNNSLDTRDSKDANMPIGSLVLIETL